jgi:di/tricarboxylate transporter
VPALPNIHAIFVLLLTVFALYLFTRDRLPLEASGLTVLITLILFFHLFPYEGAGGARLDAGRLFGGFGNEALIAICALMILGKGLETTGALQPLALSLAKAWMSRPRLASLITLLASSLLSAFVNNTPVVVMLLPMLIGVAIRSKTPPSSILMPAGFATVLGGMATTIGSSTNLLVVSIAAGLGVRQFQMFDFVVPALIVAAVGVAYLWLIAPRLLPERKALLADISPRVFNAALHVTEDSKVCGMIFSEVLALTSKEMRVDRIERGQNLIVTKLPSVRILAGDRLIVRDTPDRLKEFEKQLGATLHDEGGATGIINVERAAAEQEQLAEIVVTRGSMLHHSSLVATRFAQRTGLLPLALHRARSHDGEDVSGHIGLVPLRAGDVVLVQGTAQQLESLKRSGAALVLDGTIDLPRTHRAVRALTIFVLVVVVAALGLMPISVSAVTGVGLMLATRCLTWKDLGSALSAPLIVIIVTSLALGLALTATGGALFIAQLFVDVFHALPAPLILSSLMLGMALLTNVVSNNAAGVIGTPIAVEVAHTLGVAPEPFVLAVIFGANMSFATPFGYQTNLLVLSAGGYRFADFLRVGLPLTLLTWLAFSIVLPMFYPL